jgi:hypothetical protein
MTVSITFSHDDTVSARWTGVGRPLTAYECDLDLYNIKTAVETLQDNYSATISIATVTQPFLSTMRVTLTDASFFDLSMPVPQFRSRKAWATSTAYLINDTVTANGAYYIVTFDHTSDDTSFDPNANDGMGHDYYDEMVPSIGNALPAGGSVRMNLKKSSGADYAVTWGFDIASDIIFTPATGSTLSSDNVAAALEELATQVAEVAVSAANVTFSPPSGSELTSTNVADALVELEGLGGGGGGGSTGRRTIWVPAGDITPLLTGGCATGLAETPSEKNLLKTLDFDSSSIERAQFEIAMPKSWDKGNISFKLYWSHASTTTNFGVRWEVHCNSFDPGADLDQTVIGFVGSSDTGGSTNTLYVTDETDPLEVDDPFSGVPTTIDNALLIFRILRFPGHSDDTLAIDARLHGIQVYYNASTGSDD